MLYYINFHMEYMRNDNNYGVCMYEHVALPQTSSM